MHRLIVDGIQSAQDNLKMYDGWLPIIVQQKDVHCLLKCILFFFQAEGSSRKSEEYVVTHKHRFLSVAVINFNLSVTQISILCWHHPSFYKGINTLFHTLQRVQFPDCRHIELSIVNAQSEWPFSTYG